MNMEEISNNLESRKANLEKLIEKVSASNGDTGDYQKELDKLAVVMKKIDDGNYTNCSGCGEALSEAILQMIPYTTHCKNCV